MKNLRLLAALPLIVMGLAATVLTATASEVVLPEQLFPQLDGILKKAVQQSPRMLSRALDLEVAENNRVAARAGMLPSVSASYSYYKSKDKQSLLYDTPGSSSASTFTLTKTPYSASISQPLFHWGMLNNTARIGAIQQNIAEGQYHEAYRMLAQALRAEYLRLILLKLNSTRANFHRDISASQLKQEEERLVKKATSEAEIFSVRLNHERAQISAERAEFDLQNARNSFARLAGIGKGLTNDDIPDEIPQASTAQDGLNQMLAAFLGQKDPVTTEAVTFRQQLEVENLTYEISRKRLWPKFNASAGLSQDEQDNYFGSGGKYKVNSVYAGFSINWTIFDGFAARSAVRNSLVRRRQLENDYRQLTERLAQDAQSQVKLAGFAVRSMSITDRLLVSGEGNLSSKDEEFRRGVRSEAELNQAKLGLYEARFNAYSARRDYLLSVGDFLGTVMEDPVLKNLSAHD
jgi:outer membrane protein TolC